MTRTVKSFVNQNKIRIACEWADSNPNMPDAAPGSTHYKCVLKMGRKQMTVPFTMGSAHTSEPDAATVLDCLRSDASCVQYSQSFEDFCDELGYDTDSRKAERTFKTYQRQTRRLEQFLGSDLYTTLMEDVEAL